MKKTISNCIVCKIRIEGRKDKILCASPRCKSKRWSKNNPERKKELQTNWRNNNRERQRELWNKWNRENKEKKRLKDKKYYEENKEILYKKSRQYILKNPEKNRGYKRKYDKSERGRVSSLINSHKRISRKKMVINAFTLDDWEFKRQLTGGRCKNCDKNVGTDKLQMDHIFPLSKAYPGMIYSIDDVQALCSTCNQIKSAKVIQYGKSKR